ncbi:bladder cancer-related protein BC10 domain-containing protein [Ditylenchus destructor]|nr:bladder cancer-related protein BC10 domain-containing protein [Ditylenchus destructor]
MYCLQWLIPVLLIPKHLVHPTFLIDQALFLWFYIIGFVLERRPCYICMLIFSAAVFFICYSDEDKCVLWPICKMDDGEMCQSAYEQNLALTP